MQDKRIVIAGLCRDNADAIPLFIKRTEVIRKLFSDSRVVVFENDSEDNTRDLLKGWARTSPGVDIVDCPNDCKLKHLAARSGGSFSKSRMERMCEYRNMLLDHIMAKYADFDNVMMLDIDLAGPISLDGMAHTFGLPFQWDCVSAYGLMSGVLTLGKMIMYDGLAFRSNKSMSDKWTIVQAMHNCLQGSGYVRGSQPVRVLSNFCGAAIYHMESLHDIRYRAKGARCEHICLHEDMHERGFDKHYMNPNMILLAGLQGNPDYPSH